MTKVSCCSYSRIRCAHADAVKVLQVWLVAYFGWVFHYHQTVRVIMPGGIRWRPLLWKWQANQLSINTATNMAYGIGHHKMHNTHCKELHRGSYSLPHSIETQARQYGSSLPAHSLQLVLLASCPGNSTLRLGKIHGVRPFLPLLSLSLSPSVSLSLSLHLSVCLNHLRSLAVLSGGHSLDWFLRL